MLHGSGSILEKHDARTHKEDRGRRLNTINSRIILLYAHVRNQADHGAEKEKKTRAYSSRMPPPPPRSPCLVRLSPSPLAFDPSPPPSPVRFPPPSAHTYPLHGQGRRLVFLVVAVVVPVFPPSPSPGALPSVCRRGAGRLAAHSARRCRVDGGVSAGEAGEREGGRGRKGRGEEQGNGKEEARLAA